MTNIQAKMIHVVMSDRIETLKNKGANVMNRSAIIGKMEKPKSFIKSVCMFLKRVA
jgi:hypothetical protein